MVDEFSSQQEEIILSSKAATSLLQSYLVAIHDRAGLNNSLSVKSIWDDDNNIIIATQTYLVFLGTGGCSAVIMRRTHWMLYAIF